MLNIKKQIKGLYFSSVLGELSLTGAWVTILAARGFSLVEIGIAETIFHITSLMFEIPSGALADIFGRKQTLIVSSIMKIIGCIIMVFSTNLPMVCTAISFMALCYNFSSGSGDALAFDSMKSVKQESYFEKYTSNQLIIYRICNGLSTLCAGLALFLGYRLAYSLDIIFSIIQIMVLASLIEVRINKASNTNAIKNIGAELLKCFKESLLFLKKARKAMLLMFSNSLIGALDILLLFFLQAKLPEAGIPDWALGFALLTMEIGGVIGAKLILKLKRVRYRFIFTAAAVIIFVGILLEHSGLYIIMAIGGFAAAMADDALQVRTNTILMDMFPSEQRATLVSVESFTFSMIMIVLSPLAGMFFGWW